MSEAPDLGTLLRSWRARVRPAEVGSPFGRGSTRTPGLRREEVAWLAGVSPDYVKRLEQGRAHPSVGVLRALARALRLSDGEYELACRLAGHADKRASSVPQHITPSVRRLLDRFRDTPMAVFDAAWTQLERNELWRAIGGDVPGRNHRQANIVWRTFLGDPGPIRHDNLAEHKQALVSDLRDAATRYPADADLAAMIKELRTRSPEFADLWTIPSVAQHGNTRKTFDHPQLGPVTVDCDVMSVHGADLRIIVFTAEPGSEAESQLRLLAVLGTQEVATREVATQDGATREAGTQKVATQEVATQDRR